MDTGKQHIFSILDQVADPEIPVLSIIDLGIVRDVVISAGALRSIEVVITPTYSGCPAMDVISMQIRMLLMENGFVNVVIRNSLSPAWTTDWMTARGKERLKEYGIAPPQTLSGQSLHNRLFAHDAVVECPQCGSLHTKMLSEFGSTACKSLYRCLDCLEPFDYFKCH